MKPRHLIPLMVVVLMLLGACGAASSTTSSRAVEQSASAPQSGSAAGSSPASNVSADSQAAPNAPKANGASLEQQESQRMVIKTATIAMQVADINAAEQQIRTRTQTLGGYVGQSQMQGDSENRQLQITIRVPTARFDDMMNEVQGLAKNLISKSVQGDDVTEEYIDLESHKKTLEATRDRLLSFLQKAGTVEETLKINDSLNQYQTQIDQIEGRMAYLTKNAGMSTINVSLSSLSAPKEPVVIQPAPTWDPSGLAGKEFGRVIRFGQGLLSVIIVLLVWSPVWGPLLLLGWFIRRKLRGEKPVSA